jgi:ribosome-binding protein aMBF1 (putative translation factor)
MPTSGSDLRAARAKSRIEQQDLARHMGKHRNTVKRYEDLEIVPSAVVALYVRALSELVAERDGAGAPA